MAGGRGVAVVLQAVFGLPGHCRMGIGDRAGVESGAYRTLCGKTIQTHLRAKDSRSSGCTDNRVLLEEATALRTLQERAAAELE